MKKLQTEKSANSKIIEAIDVYKTFRMGEITVDVLRGIDLEINKGEFVSIMGPSGSGKSTLLYLIGGLDSPSSGKLLVNGREMSGLNDSQQSLMRRQDIGFIFQFYNLIPNLNIEENIMLPVMFDGKKVSQYKTRINQILEDVGLAQRKKHTPRELSGGEQQRVAIARALINDPDILLADEAIGNLDSKTGNDIMQLLKNICQYKKKTIFQVTHSREAADFGHRIIYLKDGRITE